MKTALWLGLTAGNFIYQWFTDCNYLIAFEHSWFQGAALLSLFIAEQIKKMISESREKLKR